MIQCILWRKRSCLLWRKKRRDLKFNIRATIKFSISKEKYCRNRALLFYQKFIPKWISLSDATRILLIGYFTASREFSLVLLSNVINFPCINIWAPSSEFVSSSIPSWQISTAHVQPFRGARDLVFCLKVPLDSLLVWASSEGSGETARMRRLPWTFAARIGDKYQIRLTRSI